MLDELERLDRAATPGRWEIQGRMFVYVASASGPKIACCGVPDSEADRHNAAFIAAARNALPALLRVARAADSGEWHSSKDCQAEGRAATCELCQALAVLEAAHA